MAGGSPGPGSALPRRGGGSVRRPLIIVLALVIVIGGGYLFLGDEIADTVNVILYGEPASAPTPARPVAKRSQPVAAATAPAAVATAPSAGLSAVASSAGLSAAAPTAMAPSTGLSAVAVSAPLPARAAGAPVAATAATPAPAASQPPAQARQPAPRPPAARVAAISPEQDLPSVLDRIRQQRSRTALQPSAVVDRSANAASAPDADQVPAGTAAAGMVSVAQEPARTRDDAERAYDMLLHGQYEGAIDLYDSVLKASPDYVAALLGKAIALHKLRRPQEARPFYQRVLALDPENREALTNMTAIVAAQAPVAALRELRDLQKTYPGFSPIPAQIAEIEAQGGDFAAAIASFDRAIQLSPENGLYRLNLAIIQDRAGMPQEAANSYQAALDRLDARVQLPIPIESIRARLRYLRSR